MTRINTNVSSLVAQKTLSRTNTDLQSSLTRLSTGLRINVGKDDPAGLIASEALRSDITSVEKAISNSERANQLIATADSALGQVSNLLNDIRGLVTEAANEGVLSAEQVSANQLQIDSSLEAIDRIAQTTTFQGRRILDGSLDFITDASKVDTISSLKIDQANLGAAAAIDVDVDISQAAAQATLDTTVPEGSAGSKATATIDFADDTVAATQGTTGTMSFNAGADEFTVSAVAGGDFDGDNDLTINVQTDDATNDAPDDDVLVDYDSGSNTLTVYVDDDGAGDVAIADIRAAIEGYNGGTHLTTNDVTVGGGNFDHLESPVSGQLSGGSDEVAGGVDSLNISTTSNVADTTTFQVVEDAGIADNDTVNIVDNSGTIEIHVRDTGATSLATIRDAFNASSLTDGYEASITVNGDGNYDADAEAAPAAESLSGGAVPTGGLEEDLTFELSSKTGREVFRFEAGATASQMADAINLVSDAIGISAEVSTGSPNDTLTFTSTEYGSDAFVSIDVIDEGGVGPFKAALNDNFRAEGTDIEATVNGIAAAGSGNTLSINTSVLDLELTVADGSAADVDFSITGGGAVFQIGPDVVSNQQASIGIQSVNSSRLRGEDGRLDQLRSGGEAALATDPTKAAKIVEEAITQIASLRGRLGAFQKTTLESNIFTLNDTLGNLTEAESSIRDADFAAESARLTRAQILVQSGTSVLSIANQNPQNVLSLLR